MVFGLCQSSFPRGSMPPISKSHTMWAQFRAPAKDQQGHVFTDVKGVTMLRWRAGGVEPRGVVQHGWVEQGVRESDPDAPARSPPAPPPPCPLTIHPHSEVSVNQWHGHRNHVGCVSGWRAGRLECARLSDRHSLRLRVCCRRFRRHLCLFLCRKLRTQVDKSSRIRHRGNE